MLQQVRDLFASKPWASQQKLCQDLSGIDVPLLTIDEPSEFKKKVVVI